MSKILNINIKTITGKVYPLTFKSTDKIKSQVIPKIAETLNVPSESVRIVNKGKDFDTHDPNRVLEDYCVRSGDVFHIPLRFDKII